jgi:hypothetical protein
LARMQGMAVALFFIWLSATLRMRGSRRKFDHLARVRYSLPGVDPTQGDVGTRACATTANRTPSIQDAAGMFQSHPSNDVSSNACNRICERRSTLLKRALVRSYPVLAASTQLLINYISTPMEEDLMIIVTGGGICVGGYF